MIILQSDLLETNSVGSFPFGRYNPYNKVCAIKVATELIASGTDIMDCGLVELVGFGAFVIDNEVGELLGEVECTIGTRLYKATTFEVKLIHTGSVIDLCCFFVTACKAKHETA